RRGRIRSIPALRSLGDGRAARPSGATRRNGQLPLVEYEASWYPRRMSRSGAPRRNNRPPVAGRYTLGRRMQQDEVGAIWHGVDTLLQRGVVVREIATDTAPEADRAALDKRILREARAIARIGHPGVVTLFDVVQEDGRTYIITERTKASTLLEVVEADGPRPARDCAAIGTQLLAALEVAHRKGIVHHDIQPANVLIGESGAAKLTNFSVALLPEDLGLPSRDDPGARPYRPPEESRGTAGGDLWALGATLHFAAEGDPPEDDAEGGPEFRRAG